MGRIDNSRRFFLHLLAGSTLGSLVDRPLERALSLRAGTHESLVTGLTSILGNKGSARVIGGAFLRRFPEESKVETLVDAICGASSQSSGVSVMNQPGRRRELLVRQIRDDFANGRVHVLEGWVLSATEARLCALVALA